jgi:hypothetical protein
MKLNFSSPDIDHFFKQHARSTAYVAFLVIVLACVLAAVMVANNNMPLELGGL